MCYLKIGKSFGRKVKRSKRKNIRIAVAGQYLKLSDVSFFSVLRARYYRHGLAGGNSRFFDISLTSFDIPFTYLFLLSLPEMSRVLPAILFPKSFYPL